MKFIERCSWLLAILTGIVAWYLIIIAIRYLIWLISE
jgi:hypothetical protein